VRKAREAWKQSQASLDITKLVFLDETWTATNMARRYGRAGRGERCTAAAPFGRWETTTFVAGLRHDRLTAPMVAEGPMDGEMFVAYVRTFLCPVLQPGDLVIADNLSSHKVAGVSEAIEAVGAKILLLPPYSPDLNPIEKVFAKLKALLRRAATRTTQDLWAEIGNSLTAISAQECRNYYCSCGYVNT